MFDRKRDAIFDRHLEPFGAEDDPLHDVLYSITRATKREKPQLMTPAMKLAAAKRLMETEIPPAPLLPPKRTPRPVHGRPLASMHRARGG